MTTPNLGLGNFDDYDTVVNAVGISVSQSMNAQDWVDQQIDRVTGEFGGIVEWITDGLASVIQDVMTFVTTGDVKSLEAAAAYVQEKISDFVFEVIEVLQGLFLALTNNYTGDNEWLIQIQTWRNSLFGWVDDVADFIQNLLDAILRGVRGIPVVGGSLADIIEDVGGLNETAVTAQSTAESAASTADNAKTAVEDTVKNMYNTWFGGSSAAGNPNEATYVIQAVKDAIINGYTVETKTTSGTWTKPSSISELIVICVGGGADGADGAWNMAGDITAITAAGGAGGTNGGYVTQAFDPATIDSTVPCTVGSPGLPSSFGSYVTSVPGAGGISSQFGFTPTVSIPGSGGKGGDCVGNSPQSGVAGGSSAIGPGGGAGAAGSGNGTSPAGTNGTTVALTVPTKCGGGGAGGGGARVSTGVGQSVYGGAGGNGGYPGGGGGGGGGVNRGNLTVAGTGGAKGVGAAGVIWIFHR